MELLRKCIHESDEYEVGRKEVSLKIFKYVIYDIDKGQERKNIELVTSKVWVCDFIKDFIENTWQYFYHVDVAWWEDKHFRICKDTFLVGIVLSVVYFVENYTLQP